MEFKWLYRWLFPNIAQGLQKTRTPPSVGKNPKILCPSQLEYLTVLLAKQLDAKVVYVTLEYNRAAQFLVEGEVVARVTFHPKGLLRRQHYVRARLGPSCKGCMAWFQLVFLGSTVKFVSLEPELVKQS